MAEQLANNAASTLSAGIDNIVTSLTVANGTVFPATGNFRIIIDSEIIVVGARSGNTLSSLTRGAETTTASSHSSGVDVTHILTKGGLDQYLVERTQPHCRLTRSSVFSVPNNAPTVIPFDVETFDPDGMHEGVTNPSRITVVTTGVYLIYGHLEWTASANTTTRRQISILSNGTTVMALDERPVISAVGVSHSITTTYALTAGAFIELRAFHTDGAALNIAQTLPRSPVFGMARIGAYVP